MLKPEDRKRDRRQRYSPPSMVELGEILALTQGDA
jgi:hypothetical protein